MGNFIKVKQLKAGVNGQVLRSLSGDTIWVDDVSGGTDTVADTGTVIHFSANTIFDLPTAPSTGNYTNNLTGAKIGIVQKMYHNHSVAPTFPVGWVLVGDGVYFTNELNIIYAEWVDGTRVEYWIIQEQ